MKLDNYFKINKWIDFSIGQITLEMIWKIDQKH